MSDYTPQAPAIWHDGTKIDPSRETGYRLSDSLLRNIFSRLNGKRGNQIKLITVLMGVAGNGTFRLSQKWIMDQTGMDESGYKRARKALIDLGWIAYQDGSIHVHFDRIRGDAAYDPKDQKPRTPPPGDILPVARQAFEKKKRSPTLIDLDNLD